MERGTSPQDSYGGLGTRSRIAPLATRADRVAFLCRRYTLPIEEHVFSKRRRAVDWLDGEFQLPRIGADYFLTQQKQ